MIPVSAVLLILLAHWFADFVCQSDWMAQNKSKRVWPLIAHISVYTLVLTPLSWKWALVNGLAHMAVDAVTSRVNSKLWAAKQVHWFFVSVGFDQLVHTVTLIATYSVFR